MALPVFQVLSGVVDGVNNIFSFSVEYLPGTAAIYLNGQLLLASPNPWVELDPVAGTIQFLEQIPVAGDVVAGFALKEGNDTVTIDYLDAAIVPLVPVSAELEEVGFEATAGAELVLSGSIYEEELTGTVAQIESVAGEVNEL